MLLTHNIQKTGPSQAPFGMRAHLDTPVLVGRCAVDDQRGDAAGGLGRGTVARNSGIGGVVELGATEVERGNKREGSQGRRTR